MLSVALSALRLALGGDGVPTGARLRSSRPSRMQSDIKYGSRRRRILTVDALRGEITMDARMRKPLIESHAIWTARKAGKRILDACPICPVAWAIARELEPLFPRICASCPLQDKGVCRGNHSIYQRWMHAVQGDNVELASKHAGRIADIIAGCIEDETKSS